MHRGAAIEQLDGRQNLTFMDFDLGGNLTNYFLHGWGQWRIENGSRREEKWVAHAN